MAGASRPSWVRFSCSSLFFFPPSLPPPFPSCKEYSLGIVLVTSRQVTDRPKPQWLQAPFYGAWFCRLVGHVAPLLAGLGHGAGLSWRRGLVLMLGSWCQWLGHLGPPPRGLPSRVPWTGSHGRCRPRGRVGFCRLSSGPDPEVTQHCFYHILPQRKSRPGQTQGREEWVPLLCGQKCQRHQHEGLQDRSELETQAPTMCRALS